MDQVSLIIHVSAGAVLVGGMALLYFVVTPATRLVEDEGLRRTLTRVVARRFAVMTIVALLVLLATGLYQFYAVVSEPVRENMNDFRWGPAFGAKMTLFVLLIALVAVHGAVLGPRIARQAERVAGGGGEEAALRLASLRRSSARISLVMLLIAAATLAIGVLLGDHDYSYIAR